MPRKPSLSRHLRDARIKRGLSVAEVAEQVGVTAVQHIFLGDGSLSATGCEPERIVQGVEAASQGDAGDGGGVGGFEAIVSSRADPAEVGLRGGCSHPSVRVGLLHSVWSIAYDVSWRIVVAHPDLPPSIGGDGAAHCSCRAPYNLRVVAADAGAGIAANIISARLPAQ